MEQMYMIEIFIDKVTIFSDPQEADSSAEKNLIVTVKFGPKTEFVIKEGAFSQERSAENDEAIICNEKGRQEITRSIRVGKSYLFPSYPDTVLQILDRFPLEISVFNDDENEKREFVGIGTMFWDTEFYNMLRNTANTCKSSKPLSIKQNTPLMDECCCGQVGSISFILRLTALGGSIMTTFQQMPHDPESFVFTTDKNSNVFQCKQIDGEDPNFCMIGNLYDSTTLEDPDILGSSKKMVQVCTNLSSCAIDAKVAKVLDKCGFKQKTNEIQKIRMGDIRGPCGNVNCSLAEKIKTYLRNTNSYKKQSDGNPKLSDKNKSGQLCGECLCQHDEFHRENCAENEMEKDQTENEEAQSKKSDPRTKKIEFQSYMVLCQSCGGFSKTTESCANWTETDPSETPYIGCREIPADNNCSCNPPKQAPFCGAFDCVCHEEAVNRVTRKKHRSYCPSYQHKTSCPVTMMNQEPEDDEEHKEDDEKEEPLPYGVPPIKLGPCPVIGRPCSVPDGFAKMYKPQPLLPPSYSEAGKICCSKEFERIKKFLTEYMKDENKNDYRCFNALGASTSVKRCCDKEQRHAKLSGKDCCGLHKIQGMPE